MKPPRRKNAPAPSALPTAPRADGPFLRYAGAIFLVALAVRLLHVYLLSRSPFFHALLGDARGYDDWARRIAGGQWIGTDVFYQAPLYPYFLAVVYKIFGHNLGALRVVQAVIGAGSCALVGLAGYRFFSVRVGVIAGGALALYAPALFFDALIQKSVLDLFFLALSLWLVGRLVDEPRNLGDWLLLGLAMGGLSLTRENALVFVVIIVGWAMLRGQFGVTVGARVNFVASFLVGLAIVLLPVAVRNYAVGGGFYLTTAQFGPNFFIGNNPQADGTYASLRFGRGAPEYERTDATELAEHALGRSLTPSEVSSYWTNRGLDFIRDRPGAWFALMARKAALLINATEMLDTEAQESHAEWSWPLRVGGLFGHFGVLAPLACIGLVLAWRHKSRVAVLYFMLAAYAASVLLFFVFARYRLPLVPLLLLFAAEGVSALPTWLRTAKVESKAWVTAAVAATAVLCNWPILSASTMKAITETNLAVALQADGRTDAAAEHYKRAIALQPAYAPAYNNLGVMQRATGHIDEAIATYRQALLLKGDYPDAHYNLANALLAQNKPQEAADHFKIALQSIPDSAGAANNLGVALSAQDKPDAAVAAFRAAVAAEPRSAVAHRNLADALSTAGQTQEAVAEFHRAIELDPTDPSAPYNLGVVLLQAGHATEAVPVLRTAVQLSPRSVDARNNLGIALASSGDLDAAIQQFTQALAIDASSPEARRNLEMAEGARAQASGRRP